MTRERTERPRHIYSCLIAPLVDDLPCRLPCCVVTDRNSFPDHAPTLSDDQPLLQFTSIFFFVFNNRRHLMTSCRFRMIPHMRISLWNIWTCEPKEKINDAQNVLFFFFFLIIQSFIARRLCARAIFVTKYFLSSTRPLANVFFSPSYWFIKLCAA